MQTCRSFSVWSSDQGESCNEFSSPARLLGDTGDAHRPSNAPDECLSDNERTPIKVHRYPSSKLNKPKIKITQPSFDTDAAPDC